MNKNSIYIALLLAAFILIMPAFSQPGGGSEPMGPGDNRQGSDNGPSGFNDQSNGFNDQSVGSNDKPALFDDFKPMLNNSAPPEIKPDKKVKHHSDKPSAGQGKKHHKPNLKKPIDSMFDDSHKPGPFPPMKSMMGPQKLHKKHHHIENMMIGNHFPPMNPLT